MILHVPLTGTSSLSLSREEQKGRRKRIRTKVMTAIALEEAASSGIRVESFEGVRAEIL
jgi:hypothetical protein